MNDTIQLNHQPTFTVDWWTVNEGRAAYKEVFGEMRPVGAFEHFEGIDEVNRGELGREIEKALLKTILQIDSNL